MAITSNLSIDQYANFSSVVDLSNDDGTEFDLSNYTILAQIRKEYSSTTFTAFITTVDLPTAQITLSLTKEQTGAMKAGRYVYDVLIINNMGYATRAVEGIVTVNPGASR